MSRFIYKIKTFIYNKHKNRMSSATNFAWRFQSIIFQAIERMNEEFKSEKAKGTAGLADYNTLALEFMKVDFASFKSVLEFCDAFKKSGRSLHVLFCNAGLGLRPYGMP